MPLLTRMLALGAAALVIGAGSLTALAQTGFPPWPLLFEGTVLLDGEPAEGALFARVGDWQSDDVPVVDGAFQCADPCLIVGPPTFAYIGDPVTFHLIGERESGEHIASLTFPFPEAPEPSRTQIGLLFHGEPNEGVLWGLDGPLVGFLVLVGLVLVAAIAGGVGYRMGRRARR